MQAWNQWNAQAAATYAAQGYQTSQSSAAAVPAASAYPMGYQYYGAAPTMPTTTPDMSGYTSQQWTVMQQQHWQQWQQWQQQFQQWQQQYGDKYQESLNSTSTPGPAGITHPPPLPPPDKSIPPPPPEEADPRDTQADAFRASGTSKGLESSTQDSFLPGGFGPGGMSSNMFSVPPPSVPPPPVQPPTVPSVSGPPPPSVPPPNLKGDDYGKCPAGYDGYQTSKRPYESESTFRVGGEFSGGSESKKSRIDNFVTGGGVGGGSGGSGGGGGGSTGGGNSGIAGSFPFGGRNSGIEDRNQSNRGGRWGSGVKDADHPAPRDNPDELSEAEKAFDIQFKQWEEQFNKWKEQNINHPDKTQYREYEAKWESWREQLLQRREQMRKKRESANKSTADMSGSNFSQSQSNRVVSSGSTSPSRSRNNRGRGGYFDGSRMQEEFRSSQDGSNKGSFSSQQDQKSIQEAFGGFGSPAVGFGMQQQNQKMGQGVFGLMTQPPKISPGNMSGNQGGFGNLGTTQPDQKLNQSGQESTVCGSNVEQSQNQNASQSEPGSFGVQDQSGPQKSFSCPGAAPQNIGNSKDSPHVQQLQPFQEVTSQDKKPEESTLEEQKGDGKGGVELKSEFLKNSAGGIPGLDLLAEQRPSEKDNTEAQAKAEERDLSVGHDKDERLESVQTSFIGPMPGPPPSTDGNSDIKPVQENSNIQATQGTQVFGPGGQGPPNKMDLGQVSQGFGSGNQGLPNKAEIGSGPQGFGGGPPNFGNVNHGSQGFGGGQQGLGSGPQGLGSGPQGLGSGPQGLGSGPQGLGGGPQGLGGGPQGLGGGPQGLGGGPQGLGGGSQSGGLPGHPFFGMNTQASQSFGGSHNFGTGNQGHSTYGIGNEGHPNQNVRQGNLDNFGTGNQGFPNQNFGSGSQGPSSTQNFVHGNRGPNNFLGFGNQGPMNTPNFGNNQGFVNHGPPNSQFPNMSQGFGPNSINNQGYGPNQGFRSNHGPMNAPNFGNQGPGNPQNFGNNAVPNLHAFSNQSGLNPQAFGNQTSLNSQGFGNQSILNPQAFGNQRQSNSQGFDNKGLSTNLQSFGTNSQGFGGSNSLGTGFGSTNQAPPNTYGPQGLGPWKDNLDSKTWNQRDSGASNHGRDGGTSLGGRNDFQGSRDNVQNIRDSFPGSRDSFQGLRDRDNFSGIRDNLTSPRDSFHGMRESTLGPRDNFHGMRENVMGPRDSFQGPRDSYDRFQAPPRGDMSGPRGGFPLEGETDRGGPQEFPPSRDLLEGDFGGDMNTRTRPRERGPTGWQRGGSGNRMDTDQENKVPDPFKDEINFMDDERGIPPEDSLHSQENERPKWDRNEQENPFMRDSWSDESPRNRRFTEPPPGKGWEDRPWAVPEDRVVRYGHGPDWESKLESATVVDYGHRPVDSDNEDKESERKLKLDGGGNSTPSFSESVQTFEYGHGASSRRSGSSDVPNSDSWRRDDPAFRGRDRDERFPRDRDWGRGNWEQERDANKRDGRFERDRNSRSDVDRDRNDRGRWEESDRLRADRDRDRDWGRRNRERDRDGHRQRDSRRDNSPKKDSSGNFPPPPDAPPPPTFAAGAGNREPGPQALLVEDLLCPPGRETRPARLVMILRGPPGSGKTFVAKLIKDKEVEMGGSAPRILCLDDYFMVEMEKEDKDPETGRKVTMKVMEYEYEAGMDKHYRSSLVKAFRKTVIDGYFPFIIVDCINDKVKHFEEMWSFAKQKGFQVYVCEMDMDTSICSKRNIHNRSESDIQDIIKNWEDTPKHYLRVDVRSLLQSVAITEVEMEDSSNEPTKLEIDKGEPDAATTSIDKPIETTLQGDEEMDTGAYTSKWERMEPSGDCLDRLDGLNVRRRKNEEPPLTMEDWLQLSDEYKNRRATGKKQVRWADLEERAEQEKMRAIGFVVGQTDWDRMTDPTRGESALTQTKYI